MTCCDDSREGKTEDCRGDEVVSQKTDLGLIEFQWMDGFAGRGRKIGEGRMTRVRKMMMVNTQRKIRIFLLCIHHHHFSSKRKII